MTVHLDVAGGVATLTLDRPDEGNRLDPPTLDRLRHHLESVASSDAHVLLLRAEGSDFCLGREGRTGAGPPRPEELDEIIALVGGTNRLLQRFPGVSIAAVRGRAVGAGLSLAGRCDLVVAGAGARLSFPEVKHGIAPTFVMSHYRFVLPRSVVNDLVMTGRELSAAEGQAVGLVSRVVADHDVEAVAAALADEMAGRDGPTVRMIKEFLVATEEMTPRTAISYGNALMRADLLGRALQ